MHNIYEKSRVEEEYVKIYKVVNKNGNLLLDEEMIHVDVAILSVLVKGLQNLSDFKKYEYGRINEYIEKYHF